MSGHTTHKVRIFSRRGKPGLTTASGTPLIVAGRVSQRALVRDIRRGRMRSLRLGGATQWTEPQMTLEGAVQVISPVGTSYSAIRRSHIVTLQVL